MKYWLVSASILLLLLPSCKKKSENLGLSIQPAEDQLNVKVSDTTKLVTYCEKGDSIFTDELSGDNLLGSYIDPYFGKVESAIFTQLRLSSSIDFTPPSGNLSDLVVDSAVLYLKLSGAYGNLQPQTFEVYRLNESLYLDSSYYSNTTIDSIAGTLIQNGEETITPQPFSLGTIGGELVETPVLSIPLDVNTFAWDIINQSGTGVLSGNDGAGEFVEWFKGVLIKTNTQQNTNEGAILYADLLHDNSKVVIFYRDTVQQDTLKFDLNFNDQTARFHRINLDYSGFYVGNELADSTLGQNLFFAQTMGGVKGKIHFPNILKYKQQQGVIVNKAELVLPVQYFYLDSYLPPSQLFLTRVNEDGKEVFIDDFADGLGGVFDADNNRYVFNITRYINKVLTGEYPNLPLSILPNKSGITANRAVFSGQETTVKDKPYLKLTFTKY